MDPYEQTRGRTLRRAATFLALIAAAVLGVLIVTAAIGSEEDENAPATVTLADVIARPQAHVGKTLAVAGRVRRRTARSYELAPRRRGRTLLVRRRRHEPRPHVRRGDRIEVIGEMRAAPARAPKRVAAVLIAREVLLYDRAGDTPRDR